MLTHILIAILIGTLLGILTGLTPGIHINLISLLILTYSPFFLKYTEPLILCIIIIAMAVTHTFLDTIPSIFLGVPDSDTALSILPGHRMLLEGKGYEAVMLTAAGSLGSLILAVVITPILIYAIDYAYPIIKSYIGFLLILVSLFLINKETKSKYWALFVFLLAGVWGIFVLNYPKLENPLFPLLSGLFGTSMLILSITNNTKIPKQINKMEPINKKVFWPATTASVLTGSMASFMPGLGPSQAAIIGSQLVRNICSKGFMILVGGLNTVNMIVSFSTLFIIEKARNGAIITVSQIIPEITTKTLIIFLSSSLIVAFLSIILTINISKLFSKIMSKVNYKMLCITIITAITGLVLYLTGFMGLIILIISSFIGIIPAEKGIGRNHLMGCLLLPIILFFIL